MEIKIQRKVNGGVLTFNVEEKDEKNAIANALFYLEKDRCLYKEDDFSETCGSENIVWNTNKAKTDDGTFTYIKRFCVKCKATSTAGEYKEGGFFWKKWEMYVPKGESKPMTASAPASDIDISEEIDF